MPMQQMPRMRLGVPTLTPPGETKWNCRTNGNYGGGRRFDHAMNCYRDEDFAGGVGIADEPMHGILCRQRQQRIVARQDAVAKGLTARLRSHGRRRTASAYSGSTDWERGRT